LRNISRTSTSLGGTFCFPSNVRSCRDVEFTCKMSVHAISSISLPHFLDSAYFFLSFLCFAHVREILLYSRDRKKCPLPVIWNCSHHRGVFSAKIVPSNRKDARIGSVHFIEVPTYRSYTAEYFFTVHTSPSPTCRVVRD